MPIDKELKFELLENGLDFIESALMYFLESVDKSDLKYGILHLSSGIELILKYRLSHEHWSLLFQDIKEANRKLFDSGDFKSVDSKTCIDRLEGICSLEFDDNNKRILKHLRERRNKLEHFGIIDSSDALKASSVDVLNFLLEFIEEEIDINPEEYSELNEIRTLLGGFTDFVEHRSQIIKAELEERKKNSCVTYCPTCYIKALVIDDGANCLFCGYTADNKRIADEFIENILGINGYICMTDGGEYPLYYCIDCGNETMVRAIKDDDLDGWICFSCGTEWDTSEISFCSECGEPYRNDEDDFEICEDCMNYKISKD